jgi:hypothetical protein
MIASNSLRNQILCIYFPLKCISLVLMFLVLPTIAQRSILEYLDLTTGQYGTCGNGESNLLYSLFMCGVGIKTLESYPLILLSFILSSLRDIIFIGTFYKTLEARYSTLFVVLLALHPYLAYSHLRFTTDFFASLGILHIFIHLYYQKRIDLKFVLIAIILSGFRNGLIFVYFGLAVFEFFKVSKLAKNKKFRSTSILILLLAVVGSLFTPVGDYLKIFVSNGFSYGSYSYYEILTYLSNFGDVFAYIAVLPTLFISHLILLLGFRELVAGYGIASLVSGSTVATIIQFSSSAVLLVLHSYGLVGYFQFAREKKSFLLIPFLYVFPSFLIVAHMRYLGPLIPLLLFGTVILIKKKFELDREAVAQL